MRSRGRGCRERQDAVRYGQLSFRVAPLAVLVTAAAASLLFGHAWSARMAAVPWLVAIVLIGLPHGAADLAVSRRLCGWPATVRLFAVYAALMAAVTLAMVLAPQPTVVLFAALSVWHFGLSHAQGQSPPLPEGWPWQAVAAVARGASVLGVPLAVWPAETAAVVTDLIRLVGWAQAGTPPAFAPAAIRLTGICLTLTAMLALATEAGASRHMPGALRRSGDTLVDLLIIGLLGTSADPLFAIGFYFLCWHAWREMQPLMAVIAQPAGVFVQSQPAGVFVQSQPAGSDQPTAGLATLVRELAVVHAAALPLLIPTWTALAVGWWLLSPSHSPHDLAVLSLAVYLVVTPAHEALHDVLRAGGPLRRRQASPSEGRPTPSSPFRPLAHACTARSASS
jgi:Brp/Blh family beta-carotene 15,15'-monooxygenase